MLELQKAFGKPQSCAGSISLAVVDPISTRGDILSQMRSQDAADTMLSSICLDIWILEEKS